MSKTRVLVTGASGFIGRNLFEEFSRRENLKVIGTFCNSYSVFRARKFLSDELLIKADLLKKEDALRITEGVDVVIHAAAVSAGAKYIVGQPDFLLDNTTINTNIIQAAYANNVKHFIFLSCSVLYPMDFGRPVSEDGVDYGRIHPRYFIGAWVKIYGEKLCEFYAKLGRTKFTIIRHSNIYGPYDKFDLERGHVFGATVVKAMNAPDGGKITIWGEGKEARDLVYISDFVRFIESVIAKVDWQHEVFNVGYGSAVSVKSLVEYIVNASGKTLHIEHDHTKPVIEDSALALDIRKSARLGWRPEVGIDDGIRRTMDWYKMNYQRGC